MTAGVGRKSTEQHIAESPLTIGLARELLWQDGQGLTDEEVLQACDQAEAIANVIVEMYQEHRKKRSGTT